MNAKKTQLCRDRKEMHSCLGLGAPELFLGDGKILQLVAGIAAQLWGPYGAHVNLLTCMICWLPFSEAVFQHGGAARESTWVCRPEQLDLVRQWLTDPNTQVGPREKSECLHHFLPGWMPWKTTLGDSSSGAEVLLLSKYSPKNARQREAHGGPARGRELDAPRRGVDAPGRG